MPLQLTPLEANELAPAVARAAGPDVAGPAKMMAARGLAPMGPRDLVTAVYQLTHDADPKVADAARQTADKLPDTILSAALGDALHPRVLEHFATRVIDRPPLVEAVLLNQHTHDETFVTLAGKLPERELEILAGNQLRLLRHPPIIEALYFNPAARASTIDRVLELAVRNGLELSGIPQFKELAALIMGSTSSQDQETAQAETGGAPATLPDGQEGMDELFANMLSQDPDEGSVGTLEYEDQAEKTEEVRNIGQLPIAHKIRLAQLGKQGQRAVLVRDSNKIIAMAAITSPKVTDREVIMYAANRSLCEDVIRYIASRREWAKHYQLKVNLAGNPKCPLPYAMRLLTQLRANDLKILSRSKNIPSALAKAAKRLSRK